MKPLLALTFLLGSLALSGAATTINAVSKFSCGANLGWMDWRGDTNSGVVIGEFVCAGNLYSANVGWISLGGGTPTNGIQYQNLSPTDCGVNQDGLIVIEYERSVMVWKRQHAPLRSLFPEAKISR